MSKYVNEVKVRLKKELSNSLGKIETNDICYLEDVWLNTIANSVYVRLGNSKDVKLITSTNNLEIMEKGE